MLLRTGLLGLIISNDVDQLHSYQIWVMLLNILMNQKDNNELQAVTRKCHW